MLLGKGMMGKATIEGNEMNVIAYGYAATEA
jgi:hypothetical protein